MKKFKKINIFKALIKKSNYLDLLIKYNGLVVEYEALQDCIKDDLYEKMFERIFKETEKVSQYEKEIKILKDKVKKLRNKLLEKDKK